MLAEKGKCQREVFLKIVDVADRKQRQRLGGVFQDILKVIEERRKPMEQKIEREWISIGCPEGKENTLVMCEWDIVSEKGRILRRTLMLIDCHNPQLTEFERTDCNWGCERAIARRERKEL